MQEKFENLLRECKIRPINYLFRKFANLIPICKEPRV